MPLKKIARMLPRPASTETEFLPAALEIVETPPSPLGRIIGGTLIAFFTIALIWACFGKVDIIAVAPGKIISAERTKIIQPFETGVVRAIHVQDGQKVKTGDVLIEIDSTITEAEQDRLKQDLLQAQLEVARFKAALNTEGDPLKAFTPPEGSSPDQIALQQKLLMNQLEGIRAKLSALDSQIAQGEGNRIAAQSTINKLKAAIPLLEQRNTIHQNLAAKGYGSKLNALTTEQDLLEHQHELKVQQGHLAESSASLAALREQRRQAEAEYMRDSLNTLAEAEQKANSLSEQLVQAAQRYHLQTITAPVDGTVQQLSIHTEGGVVTPAQALLAVVPTNSALEIEAMVSNRDIGFVKDGQEAAVKIDTFNFTRYGLLHGVVKSIAQDAISRSRPDQLASPSRPGSAEGDSSEPRGQELVYAARISLDQAQMQIDDRLVDLVPGMAITAEIKTGSRPVIDYLLSPLAKHKHQAFRER